jgi:hypothetical protein
MLNRPRTQGISWTILEHATVPALADRNCCSDSDKPAAPYVERAVTEGEFYSRSRAPAWERLPGGPYYYLFRIHTTLPLRPILIALFHSIHLTNSFNSALEDLNSLMGAFVSGFPRAMEITKILDSGMLRWSLTSSSYDLTRPIGHEAKP